jgi:hypothetical protein
MRLDIAGQADIYPRLAQFVQAGLPKLATQPHILEELTRYAPAEWIHLALQPGSRPDLLVAPIRKAWTSPTPNTLILNTLLAEDFERQTDLVVDKNGQLVHTAAIVIACSLPDAHPDNCRDRRTPSGLVLEALHGISTLERWKRWPGHLPVLQSSVDA